MKPSGTHIPTLAAAVLTPILAAAVPIEIPTPGGTVTIDLPHAGPTGQLVDPDPPEDAGFRPPTIFSAPLPVGSGARALGQAGAFTAVADDATAASWNPAGLVQLESPEVSAVYRFSAQKNSYESHSSELEVGENSYTSSELNYLSIVYPFLINERNAVISLNYQETYDFTHEFTARFSGSAQQTVDSTVNQTFYATVTNFYSDSKQSLIIVSDITTEAESRINQLIDSSIMSDIDFRQSGTIDAVSPALAFDITPKFSLGLSLNVFTDGEARGNRIESTLVADYEGVSLSDAQITDYRDSTAVSFWDGEMYTGSGWSIITNSISGKHTNSYSSVDNYRQSDQYTVRGRYEEENVTEDFFGVNATIGALWAVNEKLSLGGAVDLPWKGKGTQTKRIDHQISTFDSNRVEVASSTLSETREQSVEYQFPLYWAVGGVWRWNDRFFTSADFSMTHWSMYSYEAEGEGRINPVNGQPYSSSKPDDCVSFRFGGEYLAVLNWTEIPLRVGLFWEQRPAADEPDEYWGFSLGTGISMGKDPGKLILDIAYVFEQGKNVMGALLPDQSVSSDTVKHQLFISAIWHF